MEFFSSWTLVSVSSWDTVFFLFSVILWRYLRTAITLPWNVLFLKLNVFSGFHFLYIHEWYIWLSCLLYHTISSSTLWSYLVHSLYEATTYMQIHFALPRDSESICWMDGCTESATSKEPLGTQALEVERIEHGLLGQIYYSPFHCILSPILPEPL